MDECVAINIDRLVKDNMQYIQVHYVFECIKNWVDIYIENYHLWMSWAIYIVQKRVQYLHIPFNECI